MSVELDNHWAAEDEVLTLQSEIDQLTIQLKESEMTKTSLKAKLQTTEGHRSQAIETMEKLKSEHQVRMFLSKRFYVDVLTIILSFQKRLSKIQQEMEKQSRELEKKSEVESVNKGLSGLVAKLKNELSTATKTLRKRDTELIDAKK